MSARGVPCHIGCILNDGDDAKSHAGDCLTAKGLATLRTQLAAARASAVHQMNVQDDMTVSHANALAQLAEAVALLRAYASGRKGYHENTNAFLARIDGARGHADNCGCLACAQDHAIARRDARIDAKGGA